MRFLEGFLLLLSLILIVLFFKGSSKKTKVSKYINAGSLVVLVLHFILEKPRWQLYPLYLLIFICSIAMILNVKTSYMSEMRTNRKVPRRILKVLMCFLLLFSMAVSYAFPVYKIPKPKGDYKIGTISFDLVDDKRTAIYSDNTTENRKIKVQIWYPSDNVEGYSRVPWLEDGSITAAGVTRMMGMPDFLLSHTALVKSNSFKGAPVSSKENQYPVVVISHGWTGFRNLHTDLAELLASNGYIAVSIDHTYGASVTVFEDGEVVYLNREALPSKEKVPNFLEYGNTLVNTYAGDIELMLDSLNKLNAGDINKVLRGKIDISKIGLLGHSTGGGAGVTVALKDNRVKAVMGLDSWVEPVKEENIKLGLKVPALFLRSEQWKEGPNNNHLYSLIDNSISYKELYQVNGIIHQDFTMVYMYSPLSKYMGITGKLDGWKGAKLQQDFVLSFFNKHLMNKSDTIEIEALADNYSDVAKVK